VRSGLGLVVELLERVGDEVLARLVGGVCEHDVLDDLGDRAVVTVVECAACLGDDDGEVLGWTRLAKRP
jgi:hypothetical protein